MQTSRRSLLSFIAVGVIQLYRNLLSPLMFHSCRFFPSCSEYAVQAVRRHGALHGLWMSAWRILRCHPLSRGGFDPAQ